MLLVGGFILNLLIRPVNKKYFMSNSELKKEQSIAASSKEVLKTSSKTNTKLQSIILPVAWIVVLVPITLGIFNALQKGLIIFQ